MMKSYAVLCFAFLSAVKSDSLNDGWYVQITGWNNNFSVYTKIPQDSYSIFSSGQKDSPLFDDNDVVQRWIGNSSVIFSNYFIINETHLEADRVLLVLNGIDTFGEISVNNHVVGKTYNMFISYEFDVKNFLMKGMNNLVIKLESAVKIASEAYQNQAKNYVVYPKCVPSSYRGECHVNHIRKMQASFAWDWGPAIPSSGIWKNVELVPIKDIVIMDQTIDVYLKKSNEWAVNVTILLEHIPNSSKKPVTGILNATLIIKSKTNDIELISISENISIKNGSNRTMATLVLNVPESKILRWWPNGYGDQNLYDLNISLTTPTHKDVKTKRIGFRTVELVQEPLMNGLSFFFRINDVPIFAKGSNMIPVSILPGQSSNETLREHLLRYSKEVHMNMLRIWGGGIYETDYFYDIADEYGIMIWQDFMFACSMYPTSDEFLESVKEEVIQNVWRLKSHASVVLWAGNNENEAALYGNWYGTKKKEIYKEDYIKLYVDVIKKEVESLDLTRPFVVSSPSNGEYADKNGYLGTNPYSTLYGDIHHYNYITDGWDISTYSRPRFSSEYGFQSYPSIVTLKAASRNPNEDLVIDSDFLDHRQHLLGGNSYIKLLISRNMKIPKTNNSLQDFENYVFLSQVDQAQAIKVQSESYRQAKTKVDEAGEGMTMGALYWQLNDVWQAPTWSSIDFYGRWKLLHHFAEEFFAPIIISPRVVAVHELQIFIISDILTTLGNCTVELKVHKIWNSEQTKIYTRNISGLSVQANEAIELEPVRLDDLLQEGSCPEKKCIIELLLRNQSGELIAPINYVYPTRPKELDLPACSLIASIESFSSPHNKFYNKHKVTIKSTCTQLFVRFDAGGFFNGRFSENGFHMLEGYKTVFFYRDIKHNHIEVEIRSMTLVALGQIYESPMISNRICLDCLKN